MLIVSGANKEYKQFYLKLKEDAYNFGYDFQGYDYGGLGEGIPFDVELHNPTDFVKYVGKIPDKPKIILDALERNNCFIAYMDADVRIRKRIDVEGDYDIGITVHDPKFQTGLVDDRYAHITGYLNAGVIFFNNTDNSKRFISLWIDEIKNSSANSDQEGLTNLLRKYITDWTKENHEIEGIKVRLFPASEYNWIRRYHDDEGDPKIIHYTGTTEEKINQGILK